MTVVKISDPAGMLADLVRRAASGEEVLLAHDGRPVARLSAVPTQDEATSHLDAVNRLEQLSEGQTLGGISIGLLTR